MALHGDIAINGDTIIQWSAQRTITGDHGTHTYACEVAWQDESGRDMSKTFSIMHREKDGAVLLASKVLSRFTAISRWHR